MLKLIHKISELRFSQLMDVYLSGNQENGKELYPYDHEDVQLRKAEDDFYQYLISVFFLQKDSFYAVWESEGHYVSALRLEPYSDGYLLSALETAPGYRRCGYAKSLIHAVLVYMAGKGASTIYSHVSKNNKASLSVHLDCGFHVIKDYSIYSDGSVLHYSFTLAYEYKKSEIN